MRFLAQCFRRNDKKAWLPDGSGAKWSRRRGRRLVVESLEPRELLAGVLTVTAAGQAKGFLLTTFATGFPERSNAPIGPLGIGFPASGGVLVSDGPGNVRHFPSDTDGQNATAVPPVSGASYGTNYPGDMVRVGNNLYLGMWPNQVDQINADGTVAKVAATVPLPLGIVLDPLNGQLFVASYGSKISEVNPVTGTVSAFVNVAADGLAFDSTTGILYAAAGGGVEGFNTASKAMVFQSGTIAGGADGIALGTGPVSGNLFVNTNGGTVVEINLTTKAQTIIASGGSRGDFVTVDPNGTLLLTQSDRIMRLHPSVFVPPLDHVTTTTTLTVAPGTSTFGQTVTLTAVVATGGTGIPTGTVTFTINGQAQAPVSLTKVGSSDQASFTTSTLMAGTDSITAAYSGDATFAPSSSTPAVTVTVGMATPLLSVNPVNLTYGTALASSQLSGTATWTVGDNAVTVPGSFSYTSAAGTVLGAGAGQSVSVTFTPTDLTDYSTAVSTVIVNVAQAVPQVSVNPVSLTYGTALANSQLTGTATWTVGGNPVTVAGSFTYTSAAGTVLGAGASQSESVTFTPSDATDYSIVVTTVIVDVAQAQPPVSVNPVNLTYGTALANSQLTGTVTWTVGRNPVTVAGSLTYTSAAGTVLGAGASQSESVTFTPSDATDYSIVVTTVIVNVAQAVPQVSVNPVNLTYGMALANSQLSGTATWTVGGNSVTVSGSFTYTSAAGSVLGVGAGQSESVTFTPTDSTDYSPAAATVVVTAQAVPQVSVNPVNLTYGRALANSQLTGMATATSSGNAVTVPGSFSYTSAAGTVLKVGVGQSVSVTFTPTDASDYSTAVATVIVNVAQAPLTITADSRTKTYGGAVTFAGTEFVANGLVNGDRVTSVTLSSPGAAATAGVSGSPYPIVPSAAVGTGLSNYSITYENGTLTVNPAPLTITANDATKTSGTLQTFSGKAFRVTGLVASSGDSISGVTETSDGAPASAPAGTYAIVPSAAMGSGLNNYTIHYVNGTLTVSPPLTPPVFQGEHRMTVTIKKKKVTDFVLTFSDGLSSPAGVYQVTQAGKTKKSSLAHVPVASTTLGLGGTSVIVTLGRYTAGRPLTLMASGLTGVNGAAVKSFTTGL
jgi:hypothetical protein